MTFDNVKSQAPLTIIGTDVLEVWEVKRRITTVSNDDTQANLYQLLEEVKELRSLIESTKI